MSARIVSFDFELYMLRVPKKLVMFKPVMFTVPKASVKLV